MSPLSIRFTAASRIPLPPVNLSPSNRQFPKASFQFFIQSTSIKTSTVLRRSNGNMNITNVNHESDESSSSSSTNNPINLKLDSKNLLQGLKRYGVAGMLSYGLLNTLYYTAAFTLVWFYISPAPAGKLGFAAAAERFAKLMAVVWAGSQVTKIARAAAALALAPFVDLGLSWFTDRFGFQSKAKAFAVIAAICFGFAVLLFFALTLLSA